MLENKEVYNDAIRELDKDLNSKSNDDDDDDNDAEPIPLPIEKKQKLFMKCNCRQMSRKRVFGVASWPPYSTKQ